MPGEQPMALLRSSTRHGGGKWAKMQLRLTIHREEAKRARSPLKNRRRSRRYISVCEDGNLERLREFAVRFTERRVPYTPGGERRQSRVERQSPLKGRQSGK